MRSRPRLAACVLLALLLAPARARATTEEFSTFDVERQQEDDESVIDHLLMRAPLAWRDEWERAPLAFRTAEGCLTSGQWAMDNELRLATPVGDRARFGLRYSDLESDVLNDQRLELSLHWPTRFGTPGMMFRPYHDKSRQDFALMWDVGADTLASYARFTFGFEDLFNNLWAFRQTRVGDIGEPYLRHPWEPGVEGHVRRGRWRIGWEARWLTPSVKRLQGYLVAVPVTEIGTLWGAYGALDAEAQALGFTWSAAADDRQADSRLGVQGATDDGHFYRRQWHGELGARHALGARGYARLLAWYGEARADYRPPTGSGDFGSVDRVLQAEAGYAFLAHLGGRVGGMYDRITVGRTGAPLDPIENRHKESRAYFGLDARFGRMSVYGVEGIELDIEPYPVSFHHDKGFLGLQATF